MDIPKIYFKVNYTFKAQDSIKSQVRWLCCGQKVFWTSAAAGWNRSARVGNRDVKLTLPQLK